jgi:hypothetical protein
VAFARLRATAHRSEQGRSTRNFELDPVATTLADLFEHAPVRVLDDDVGSKCVSDGVRKRAPILGTIPSARELASAELAKPVEVLLPLPSAGPEQRDDRSHDEPRERDGGAEPPEQAPLQTRASRYVERKHPVTFVEAMGVAMQATEQVASHVSPFANT